MKLICKHSNFNDVTQGKEYETLDEAWKESRKVK